MNQHYILTAFGHDRFGILSEVTGVLYRHGCDLEDSEMVRLRSEVAVILSFSSSREDIEDVLTREFRRLEVEKGLPAYFRKTSSKPLGVPPAVSRHRIHIEGIDKCGIIYAVSKFLAKNKVNIDYMYSSRYSSSLSGTIIYHIELNIEAPQEVLYEKFERGLCQLGDELNVDIQIN